MNNLHKVLLPGLQKQLAFLNSHIELSGLQVLVMGTGAAILAERISEMGNNVELIVEDYDSLMSTKFEITDNTKVKVKLMDFERTDYSDCMFDIVYAQGSISNHKRKKIVKEIKRITKESGRVCVGEVVKLKDSVPVFVEELFDSAALDPLFNQQLIPYYVERNFELIDSIDLSRTFGEYYRVNNVMLKDKIKSLDANEKSYYKKVLNQISHESNAYLKLGADKFIGFEALLLKKK